MRKILVIVFSFISVFAYGQFPVNQYQGSGNTLVKSKGAYGSDSGYVYVYSFADTTAANQGYLKNIAGITIRVVDTLFVRSNNAQKWIKIGSGSSGGAETWQQTLDNGSRLNKNNTILGSGYDFTFDSVLYFRVKSYGVGQYSDITNAAGTIGQYSTNFSGGVSQIGVNPDAISLNTTKGLFLRGDSVVNLYNYKNNIAEDSVLSTDTDGNVKMKKIMGGTIPTLQQVLDAGSTLNKDNSIDGADNNLSFQNGNQFNVVYDTINTQSTGRFDINAGGLLEVNSDTADINGNKVYIAASSYSTDIYGTTGVNISSGTGDNSIYTASGDNLIYTESGGDNLIYTESGGDNLIQNILGGKTIFSNDTANKSGVRLQNLTSASPTSTGQAIGVNALGDIVTITSGSTPNLQQVTDIDSVTTHTIKANSYKLNLTPNPQGSKGELYWDTADKTGALVLDSTNGVTLQLGQENHIVGVNKTGVQINNGQVVYINGAQGNRPKLVLAKADSVNSSMVIGVATQDIAINQEGYVTTTGIVHGINTSGYTSGDILYLSGSTAGDFTPTMPSSPYNVMRVAVALNSTNNGAIYVSPSIPNSADTNFTLNSAEIGVTQKALKTSIYKSYQTVTSVNDSTFTINRPNGTKDTIQIQSTSVVNNGIVNIAVTGTDANISASAGRAYYLPSATLSANRTITIPSGNPLDYMEIYNLEAGYLWLLSGQPVYLSDGVTAVTSLIANTNYAIRFIGSKWRILN